MAADVRAFGDPAGPLVGRLLSAASPFLHLVTEPRKRVLPDVADDVIAHGSRVRLRMHAPPLVRPFGRALVCSIVVIDEEKWVQRQTRRSAVSA
jgi:hypothetical protein